MKHHLQPSILLPLSFLLSALVVAPLLADGLGDLELSVLAMHAEGDYGTGVESDSQGLFFRLSGGDALHFRIEVPLLRTLAQSGSVLHTGVGPAPVRRRDGDGHGPGGPSGAGGQGHGGSPQSGAPPETTPPVGDSSWTAGLGDVRAAFGGRLVGGGVRLYRLDGEIGVKAPTGNESDNLGTGEWDFRLGLLGEYRFWSVTAFAGAGWSSLGDPTGVELQDVFDGYVGVESEPLGGRVLVSGWLTGNQEVVAGAGGRAVVGVGFRTTGKIRWRGSVAAGLTDGAEDLSISFGVSLGVTSPVQGRGRLGR